MAGDKNNVKWPAIRTTSIFGKLKVSADKNYVDHSTLFLSPDTSVLDAAESSGEHEVDN